MIPTLSYDPLTRLLYSPACTGPSAEHRTIRDVAITTAMDITSDLLVLSLPVSILWRVRISVRQKIGLAFSLCLSGAMVLVTIVRMAGIKLRGSGSVDIVWVAFWQQQESSIAVLMLSVSAFRSFFVPSSVRAPAPRHQGYSPSEKRRRFLHRRPHPELYDTHETNGLPQIPGATLTGLTTVIEGNRQAEERVDLEQQLDGDHGRSPAMSSVDSSPPDAELGLSAESVILPIRSEPRNAKHTKFSRTRWWRGLPQPETETAHTASTARTGYWDIMSLFRTEHSESVSQSKDRS